MSKLELRTYLSYYGFAVQNIYQYSFDDAERGFHCSGTHPKLIAWLKNGVVRITNRDGYRDVKADGSLFGLDTLEELWRGFSGAHRFLKSGSANAPFVGGGVGFLSYELGKKFESICGASEDNLGLPDWCFAFYDGTKSQGWCPPSLPIKSRSVAHNDISGEIGCNLSKEEYIKSVERIKRYLKDGDVYQVNFAQRFSVRTDKEPFKLYQALQRDYPVPYAAYLDFGSVQIISQSPELFLRKGLLDDTLVTEPIKGTRKRGLTPEEDEKFFQELMNSQKDRAELTMIIDLERNDLSRICKPGTVAVEDLYKIKSFPSVHHQVTTVKGELNQHVKLADIFKAMFPGGSVTGAPKIRAMEIIEELEPNCRGIYTGCVGYLDVRGSFQFNIAIRTIIISEGFAWFHLGGGIVADSDPEEEYLETIYKGGPFWQLFVNAEVTNGKHPFQAAN